MADRNKTRERPRQGGSYVRDKSGKLTRVHHIKEAPALPGAPIQQADAPVQKADGLAATEKGK